VQWRVPDGEQLQSALRTSTFWYNALRPHQNLDGRTPLEAWDGIDPYRHVPKRVERFDVWGGLLNGFYRNG